MVSSFLGFFVLLVATSIPASEGLIRASNDTPRVPVPLARFRAPSCTAEDDVTTCCVNIRFPRQTKLCVKFTVDKNELKVKAALALNEKQVVEKSLSVGHMCHTLAPLPITACADIYYLSVDLQQRKIETCLKVSVNNLGKEVVSKDLKCIKFEKGKFSKNSDREPSL